MNTILVLLTSMVIGILVVGCYSTRPFRVMACGMGLALLVFGAVAVFSLDLGLDMSTGKMASTLNQ